jgi:hypothetical protein
VVYLVESPLEELPVEVELRVEVEVEPFPNRHSVVVYFQLYNPYSDSPLLWHLSLHHRINVLLVYIWQ